MCGIAGCVDLRREGRARAWALPHLRHRGPDGDGRFEDATRDVVLEHTRLAIIDPDNREADQPFTDPSGRWVMVYNGEIFNYRALRAELEREGERFRTRSDTEVLLLGFMRHGLDLLPRLRGMFAFVVHDRETGRVWAARDQIGVKPLYYRVEQGLFLAASEVRPLLRYPGLDPVLDPAGVVEFLAFGGSPSGATLVRNARALPPGHSLSIDGGRVELRRYWSLLQPDGGEPGADPVADLRERLEDSVAAAVVSDVPIGLMLSGGLDSSAVAALAARHVPPETMTAYSVGFGRPTDEALAAARLAGDLGIRHRTVTVSEAEVREDFDAWLDDLDYPTGNSTWIATSFIARAAREDGVKVLLSGDGGDEVFGGYTRWMKYLRFHDRVWRRSPDRLRRAVGHAVLPRARGLAADIARRAVSGGDLFVTSRLFHDDALRRHLTATGVEAMDAARPEARIEDLRREFDARRPGGDYLAWMSYAALSTKIVDDFLARLDKMGMRHSVEGRVPLLDPTLAAWAVSLPQRAKVPGYDQKLLLRRAVAPLLPDYVLSRPKQGFSPPIADWVQALPRIGEGSSPLVEAGLLRADALARIRAEPGAWGFQEWTLAVLTEWCRRNVPTASLAEV